MAEEKSPERQKSLEMRVAELEDKLTKLHITEEEMKAYQKVSLLLGREVGALSPIICSMFRCGIPPVRCHIFVCICVCYECGGGCLPGGGFGSAGGGFGSLGM